MFSRWRARKKKALINLPFVNRTIRKVPEKPKAYPKKETQTPVVQEEKEPIKTGTQKPVLPKEEKPKAPTKLVNIENLVLSNSISINTKTFAKEEEKKETEIDLSNRPTDDYTPEQFLQHWKIYQEQLIKKGKVSLATIFDYTPQINDNIIELLVENKALEEEFNHYKSDFLEFIRSALNNFKIQVSTLINKEFKTKKAYTPQEKYAKMLEKNPNLDILKKKFDMDVGY